MERLKKANRPNETFRTVAERNRSFKRQFVNSYGIDYTLESHYDLIIYIDDMMTPQEIVNDIITQLKLKKQQLNIMSDSKTTSPPPKPAPGKNWPSKVPGKSLGKGRDNNQPKTKK